DAEYGGAAAQDVGGGPRPENRRGRGGLRQDLRRVRRELRRGRRRRCGRSGRRLHPRVPSRAGRPPPRHPRRDRPSPEAMIALALMVAAYLGGAAGALWPARDRARLAAALGASAGAAFGIAAASGVVASGRPLAFYVPSSAPALVVQFRLDPLG